MGTQNRLCFTRHFIISSRYMGILACPAFINAATAISKKRELQTTLSACDNLADICIISQMDVQIGEPLSFHFILITVKT